MALARFPTLVALSVGFIMWTGNAAHAAATNWVGDSRAAVRLITATDHIAADSTLEAGLEFRFAKGWHGYWRTPGDAGIPPTVDWSASEDISGADISWPAPHRLVIEELQNSVYENDVVLPVKLHLKQAHTSVRVKASIEYAACSEICVPLQAELTLPLSTGAVGPSAESVLINSAQKQVPGSPDAAGIDVIRTRFVVTASEPTLVVDLQSKSGAFIRPDLFVEGAGNGIPPAPKVELQDAGKTARLTVRLATLPPPDRPLTLTLVDENRTAEFKGPAGATIPEHSSAFFAALLSALLGGLILNLMPCVLPVLSIKLFAFTRQAGGDLRDVRLGSAVTASGIMTSFLLLAASLVGLKWSGATLGWGIQFQQPWFLAGMAVLTVLFAASFFEWLPIGLPGSITTIASKRAGGPMLEAFLAGVFATLLATPCSAPFVGTAVGFALARGPSEIFAIFLCLGIGMALPYWVAALFPGCVRWLPRPGPWMLVVRKFLGILLLGTAVWLIFVLWSIAGAWMTAITTVLLACLLGYRASISAPVKGHIAALASRRSGWITAGLAIMPLVFSLSAVASVSQPAPGREWQVFNLDALPGLIANGNTVLVDVTATWCLTCKVNELRVLENAEVRSRFQQSHVIRMRADWSRTNPLIADYLRRFGRYGIPFDVVYGPGRPQGEALPELLTTSALLHAIDRASVQDDNRKSEESAP
ncbi:protein-disulfide reductase DsbD family protein [Bradyrhizobium erythrophlei]|uniref:Suppressor for copper-sensitivity B n=1 Tax=Bradyrhizobium erythrophlei TaxID=1437360 RepID=A0A1M5NYD3_9BRAD|nr:protein-disulfide reductase DsbD domain-containing protein [Bradyrhizobium erythrophlei]SHG94531.1 suppressor for copper-sensitivity B [Bradyrhizobium erythrophlei]